MLEIVTKKNLCRLESTIWTNIGKLSNGKLHDFDAYQNEAECYQKWVKE